MLKAYIHRLTRTLVAFEWDLNANVAMLQITQLPGEGTMMNWLNSSGCLFLSVLNLIQHDLRYLIHKSLSSIH